jgi:hypothetical protein
VAKVWKNGVLLNAQKDGGIGSVAKSIFVLDGVVYTVGEDNGTHATVWKNGTEIFSEDVNSSAQSIFVVKR